MNEMNFSNGANEMHADAAGEVSAEDRAAVNEWFDAIAASVPDPV